MRYSVVVALLLLIALPLSVSGGQLVATASHDGFPQLTPAEDPTRHSVLPIESPRRSSTTDQTLDVGTAIGIHRTAAQTELDRYSFELELAAATNDDQRRELILREAQRVEDRAGGIRAEQRSLRSAYFNRTLSTEPYLRQLTHLHAQSQYLQSYLAVIESAAVQTPGVSLRTRLATISSMLVTVEGPLRDRAVDTAIGTAPPFEVFVTASPDGVVLAAITGDQYTREAYREDHRMTPPQRNFELDEAVNRIAEVYPVAYNESIRTGIGLVADGLYRVTMEIPQGEITAYLDGGSQNIVYEIQSIDLNRVSPDPGVEGVENGTRLVVNQTYQGGPLRIATYDNETGSTVRSTVEIDDRRIDLGPSGTGWTVAPASSRITVTATRDAGTVSVTLSLDRPQMVGTVSPET